MAELVNTSIQRTNSEERLEIIDEANVVLREFERFMEETYPKASSLYEGAKWHWQDVHDLRTKKAADSEVAALFEKQTEKWNKLEAEAADLQKLIHAKYANVTSAEERIKKARGSGPSRAVLGFPTPDQKVARYVYDRKFKYKFHDAKSEVSMLCDYPEGMLVQVRLLRAATEKLAEPGHAEITFEWPRKVPTNLDVTDEADAILQAFKKYMKEAYTKSSALYERAKWLYQEVHDLRAQKVPDMQVVALLEHQANTWTRLAKDAEELHKEVDTEFAKVVDVEERVKKARGTYPNVAGKFVK